MSLPFLLICEPAFHQAARISTTVARSVRHVVHRVPAPGLHVVRHHVARVSQAATRGGLRSVCHKVFLGAALGGAGLAALPSTPRVSPARPTSEVIPLDMGLADDIASGMSGGFASGGGLASGGERRALGAPGFAVAPGGSFGESPGGGGPSGGAGGGGPSERPPLHAGHPLAPVRTDQAQPVAVPEPASLALLAIPALILWRTRRRIR